MTPTYSFRSPTKVGQNGEHPLVILSEAKNLGTQRVRSFADAQDDTGEPIRLFLSDELMEQYVGINGVEALANETIR